MANFGANKPAMPIGMTPQLPEPLQTSCPTFPGGALGMSFCPRFSSDSLAVAVEAAVSAAFETAQQRLCVWLKHVRPSEMSDVDDDLCARRIAHAIAQQVALFISQQASCSSPSDTREPSSRAPSAGVPEFDPPNPGSESPLLPMQGCALPSASAADSARP